MAKPKHKKARQERKSIRTQDKRPQADEKTSSKEMLSPLTLVIIFLVIEVFIILLMKDDYIISYHTSHAREAAKEKNYDKALKHYAKLIKIAPDSATVNLEVANTYFEKGNYDNAITFYQRLLDLDLKEPIEGVHAKLGLCFLEKNNREKALAHFRNELEINTRDPFANFYLGEEYLKRGNYARAAQHFQVVAHDRRFTEKIREYWQEIEREVLAQETGTTDESPGEKPPEGKDKS